MSCVRDLANRPSEPTAEERLRNQLDAMSAALSGLAHEINQPLAATATYLSVARRLLGASGNGQEVAQILEKAAAQTQRASRLVSSLRDLLPCEETDKTPMGLHEAIGGALDLVRAEVAPDGIEITLEPAALRDTISADRLRIGLALCNLVRHATAAMRSTGRRVLAIRTSNPDAETIKVDMIDLGFTPAEEAGSPNWGQLTTKKAKGIAPALLSSILILEQHHGLIWAGSPRGGVAARFTFTLPLLDVDVAS